MIYSSENKVIERNGYNLYVHDPDAVLHEAVFFDPYCQLQICQDEPHDLMGQFRMYKNGVEIWRGDNKIIRVPSYETVLEEVEFPVEVKFNFQWGYTYEEEEWLNEGFQGAD